MSCVEHGCYIGLSVASQTNCQETCSVDTSICTYQCHNSSETNLHY